MSLTTRVVTPDAESVSPPAMRIEMVLPYLGAAGMETMVARATRALARRGHDIGVTCTETGGVLADELRSEGQRVSLVRALGLRTNWRAPALESWIRERRPDVLHVHSGTWLKAAHAASRAGVPRIVHTIHGLESERWYSSLQKRLAARYTHRVVAVSESLRSFLVETVGLRRSVIDVIPNGVCTDIFHPGSRTGVLRDRLPVRDGEFVIGAIGRLVPVKNHALLIDAFAELRAKRPDIVLAIVGSGPLHDDLAALIARRGLERSAFLVGPSREITAVHRDIDVFVLPSQLEGTSMSALEAMASGIPVVATAVGGTPALLGNGDAGVLVPPGDASRLAAALDLALNDSSLRERIVRSALHQVRERYSEDAMIDAYERVYRGEPAFHNGDAQCAG